MEMRNHTFILLKPNERRSETCEALYTIGGKAGLAGATCDNLRSGF